MSKQAVTFEKSLIEAENICLDCICKVLGLRSGIDGFISVNGGKTDCVVWDIGYLYTGDQMGFVADKFHFRGQLDLFSRDRRRVQVWLMLLAQAFPNTKCQGVTDDLDRETCVDCLRIAPEQRAIDEITTTELKQKGDEKGVAAFTTSVSFDIVFNAGARTAAVEQ